MKKNKRIIRHWYSNEEAVKRVKANPRIKDIYTEIHYNMKGTDIIDFEKFLYFMLSCNNYSCSIINLSFSRIKIKLITKKNNNFNSIYRIEIIDKYIAPAYVVCTLPMKDLFKILHDVVETMESNSYINN